MTAHAPCVLGATAWGFAREDLEEAFDFLFVDEAGQVSLANLVAVSRSTQNIVLMGDQMQLSQPTQGTHPGESGASLLDYLLEEKSTIPEDLGVFLGQTYRMHPKVNHFISEAIYEGRLHAAEGNEQQRILVPESASWVQDEAGILFIPVEHQGNTQSSVEEVKVITQIVAEMTGREFLNKEGKKYGLDCEDILIVAPYNHQVNELTQVLGSQARIGTVDKFQGQEAPVVILSMCSSDANESPRGLEFLLEKNRINVAISRAQALAIVVGSPALAQSTAPNQKSMKLLNIYCHLMGAENGVSESDLI